MRPIFTAHLLPVVEVHLLNLLRSLTADEWELQTIAPVWRVKDVAAHLLDTQLRKLSLVRDGYAAGPAPRFASRDDFLAFINRLNREGVEMYSRLSPAVLMLATNRPGLSETTIPPDIAWRIFTKGIDSSGLFPTSVQTGCPGGIG